MVFGIRFPIALTLGIVLFAGHSGVSAKQDPSELNDLYYGEALFYALQENHFDAITRLDAELIQHYALDEPELDSLVSHRSDAEFGVGDLELNYRMHQKAGRAIERVLDAKHVPQIIRNEAAYRLARIYFEKGYYVNALHALQLIQGPVPERIKDEVVLLRGQVEMTQRNYDTAVKLFQSVKGSKSVFGYAQFNLGVALIRADKFKKGAAQLDQVGLFQDGRREMIALRDKANLVLGNRLLEDGKPLQARQYFERVRLEGPFSNKALLWAGWANAAQLDFRSALVPWTLLHERDPTDAAVQEALLAVPYAYAQLETFGQAALLYGKAVTEFDKEIDRLDSSMRSILEGKLRVALLKDPQERNSTFIQNLRSLEDAPETRYLLELMASHDFQESVKNYRDMEHLRLNLLQWLANIEAYNDLIKIRRNYYEPLLPGIEQEFKTQDALMSSVLLRRDEAERQLDTAQRQRDINAFMTQSELVVSGRLARLEYRLSRLSPQPGLKQAKARLARLQGVLDWQVETGYDSRLAVTHEHLKELDKSLEALRVQHQLVVRLKREAYQSYEGYKVPFRRATTRLRTLNNRIKAIMVQQAAYLEKVAVKELDRRRRKLADYRVKARFALAESYDRATKKKAEEAERAIREQQNQIQEIQVEDEPAITTEEAEAGAS